MSGCECRARSYGRARGITAGPGRATGLRAVREPDERGQGRAGPALVGDDRGLHGRRAVDALRELPERTRPFLFDELPTGRFSISDAKVTFRDLATGEDLDEVVTDTYYGGAWAADSAAFLYVRTDDGARCSACTKNEDL